VSQILGRVFRACIWIDTLCSVLLNTNVPWGWAATAHQEQLQIFFVDVEGGQATLFITPTGQSLLIDTGWPGNNGRDADRILAAAKLVTSPEPIRVERHSD